VYYPESAAAVGGKAPVLFFIYGGGFITGSRSMDPPFEHIYSTVGAFFSHQGFITVVPDYRLAPEFQYPKAAEDILGAIKWVILLRIFI
jgi:acetyl esterase/lipase